MALFSLLSLHLAICFVGRVSASSITFDSPLFADSMILQRNTAAKIWGSGATPNSKVTVTVGNGPFDLVSETTTIASSNGSWIVATSPVPATKSTSMKVSDGSSSSTLTNVAFGDVILCGGQSNMGFGMNGARDKNQTSAQAKATLPPVRFYFNQGSGPNGGAGGKTGTPAHAWFDANATNSGGASANCMLTAAYLYETLGGDVPVGAIESCVGGTNVEPWTPPSGSLYISFIKPLLPFTFALALWDQGEADAKRTNSTWYSTEFPKMITGWREAFETPNLPFFYVELCTEYGAEEPKEHDFWMAQRAALALPNTGFATTTDIERALHPPDKQDVARRLLKEVLRVVYHQDIVSRGPEVVSVARSEPGSVEITFSNATLQVHAGIYVGSESACAASPYGAVVSTKIANSPTPLAYTIDGAVLKVTGCKGDSVWLNSDFASCFLYSKDSQLPAPPIEIPCEAP